MGLAIIEDEKSLRSTGLKKPILVVEDGNKIIKLASFNNDEMVGLFVKELEQYGFKINETVEDEVEVDEKSFIE